MYIKLVIQTLSAFTNWSLTVYKLFSFNCQACTLYKASYLHIQSESKVIKLYYIYLICQMIFKNLIITEEVVHAGSTNKQNVLTPGERPAYKELLKL